MKNLLACMGILVISAPALYAQELTRYRDFELGSNLTAITALTTTPQSQVKIVHARPAVIQEFEWRPRYFSGSGSSATDPVALVTFNFYNDQLFRIVVDYDRYRTIGMTEVDLIEALTNTYGQSSKPPARIRVPAGSGAPDTPIAVWGNSEYVVTLLRVGYSETFRLVLAHIRLDNLARVASVEADRLDLKEAPQRELVRRQKEAEDGDAAREKSRIENKAVFKP